MREPTLGRRDESEQPMPRLDGQFDDVLHRAMVDDVDWEESSANWQTLYQSECDRREQVEAALADRDAKLAAVEADKRNFAADVLEAFIHETDCLADAILAARRADQWRQDAAALSLSVNRPLPPASPTESSDRARA